MFREHHVATSRSYPAPFSSSGTSELKNEVLSRLSFPPLQHIQNTYLISANATRYSKLASPIPAPKTSPSASHLVQLLVMQPKLHILFPQCPSLHSPTITTPRIRHTSHLHLTCLTHRAYSNLQPNKRFSASSL